MSAPIPATTLEKFTSFGDLLRFLRRRAGLTQMELALEVGYSDAQISRLEQNLRLPDIPTIAARFVPALGLEDEPKVVDRLLDLAANVRREDAPGLGLCPYKGLNYFDEIDADLFVGRETLTTRLADRLLSLVAEGVSAQPRFLAIIGASGCGKSSLVRAGLVPTLRWNKVSADWTISILTPTAHPLESLALSLSQETDSLAGTAALMDDLARDSRSLHLCARRAVQTSNSQRLLLVVDQFEELFSLCHAEAERKAFIQNLMVAASEPDGPVLVVITLRADFYAYCADNIQLREALALQQAYIGAMSPIELRRAIEEPARRGRWELEPGLVELLLRDVGSEPGALPLLSHAMLETWHRRRGRTLTLSGYAASGGVRGAIAETAESVFADQFTPQQQAIARRIFLRLTELGEETATGDTRRRASFTELILKPEEALPTQAVINALADARLIITTQDSAEVAHEALIREWPTLRGWLEENREGLRLHRHLTEAAQDWDLRNQEPDVLYRGVRLAQAVEWADAHGDEMNPLELAFLAASQDLANCEASEREAQRQRELETAQRLAAIERQRAEEQASSAGQLRKRSIYLAFAFGIAIFMALAAGLLGWQARSAGQTAVSRELAAASINNLEVDPERSILLALQANQAGYTLEAEDALHRSILASRIRRTIATGEPGSQLIVVYSPDGSLLASASQDEAVKIWEAATGKLRFSLSGHWTAFSPDGQRLATVLMDGSVKLWSTSTGQAIPLAGPIDAGQGLAFSPDGGQLATVTRGDLPRIWDLATARELVDFPGHKDYVSGVVFSPDGRRLLTASDDGTARVWNASTGAELFSLEGHPEWVWAACFSPDGSRIATISGSAIAIWDATTGQKLLGLSGSEAQYALAFSPDSSRLATGGGDRKVTIWDATSGRPLMNLAGHSGAIYGLAFSPDGAFLTSSSDDGTLRIWDLGPAQEKFAYPHPSSASLAFSPDTSYLAAAVNQFVQIWNPATGSSLRTLSGYDQWVQALAISPNGRWIATAGDNSHVKLWEASTGRELYNWSAHTGRLNSLAFSPDGAFLATASDDYKIKLWQILLPLEGLPSVQLAHTFDLPAEIQSLAFSPDGATLAAGVQNNIKVFDLASHQEMLTLRGHGDMVVGLAFSPDGRQLVSASLDGTARVWQAASGVEDLVLGGHSSAVTGVAFSPDGRQIATASRDGSAKIWAAGSDQELLTYPGDGSGLNAIAFSPDGAYLAIAGDGGVQVYLRSVADLAALGASRVTRALSLEECQKYLHAVTAACAAPAALPTPTPLPVVTQGRICQVTNTGSLYDNYFNERLYVGLQASVTQFGWEATVLQSNARSDFGKNLEALAAAGCELIVAPGNLVEDVKNASISHPDQKYMITDFGLDQPQGNVWTQFYATDQAAFVAGYLAASVTRTGKVGVFGGVDIPQVTGFMDGFALGVAYYNEGHQTQVEIIGWDVNHHAGQFVGSFCCTTEGRQMAQQLLDAGADIILPVAGQSVGWGAAAQVKEHGEAWMIGVDTDWTVTAPEFTNIMLTSIEKRFDVSVQRAAASVAEGNFSGGDHLGTLATDEVGIAPFHTLDGMVSDQVKAELEQIKAAIIAGEIKTR